MLHLDGYAGEGAFPDLPKDSAVCLSTPSLTLNRSLSFCSISLPQTINLTPARRVARQDKQSIFMGKAVNDYNINPKNLARTFILTYKSDDPFEPVLLNKFEKPVWRPQFPDDALHFFAEPPNKFPDNPEPMIVAAFSSLTTMLNNLPLTPRPFILKNDDFVSVEPTTPPIPEEQKDLNERLCVGPMPSVGGTGGGEVLNCVGAFVQAQV